MRRVSNARDGKRSRREDIVGPEAKESLLVPDVTTVGFQGQD